MLFFSPSMTVVLRRTVTRRPLGLMTRHSRALRRFIQPSSSRFLTSTAETNATGGQKESEDDLITAMNGALDITVKAVSCRQSLQTLIDKRKPSREVAEALGELMACSLLLSHGLKGEETLQINFVGTTTSGVRSLTAISDGQLKVKAMASVPTFKIENSERSGNGPNKAIGRLLGEGGQLQVIRSHPTWKTPVHGIVELYPESAIATNLALFLAQSEQRTAALIADVKVEETQETGSDSPTLKVSHAAAVLVERLPDAVDANVETSIKNLENVNKRGLATYFTTDGQVVSQGVNASEEGLHRVLDDCLKTMEENSFRYSGKTRPHFECHCSLLKVKSALKLLPKSDIDEIVNKKEGMEMRCEFCGTTYALTSDEVAQEINK